MTTRDQPIKILFVESVDDAITRRRHRLLAADPRLTRYQLYYFYAITLTPEEQSMLELGIAPDLMLVREELAMRLEQEIQKVDPQFVLLHTGFVFRRFPSVFFAVFTELRNKYRNCSFGLQPREGLKIDEDAFDQTEEIANLQRLIFRDILDL